MIDGRSVFCSVSKDRDYRRLGTIPGDFADGPLFKVPEDESLLLASLVRTVILLMEIEGRSIPPVYQESAEEAKARRYEIECGFFEFILRENGIPGGPICAVCKLTPYLDCYNLDEWCVRLRLAMDALHRGYSSREMRTAVNLRWPRADTVTETQTDSGLESVKGKDTGVGVSGNRRCG
jgi:hypothetical protein